LKKIDESFWLKMIKIGVPAHQSRAKKDEHLACFYDQFGRTTTLLEEDLHLKK